ncbi:MAG: hypothetical protein IH795_13265 [Bacteroidetes bacterium]|nr:hypothetical protein [Bacteroidota bacterium]
MLRIDKKYQALYSTKKRYAIVTGGRGSGKTFAVQDFLVRLLEEIGQGVLYTRFTMVSVDKTIIPLLKTHSEVPGKTRAGGQSAARFERIREGAKKDHFKKVAEYMKEHFLKNKNLKGIIVGGPGPTKYDFIDSGLITTEVKKKIIAIKDLSYTGAFGLNELVEKSQDILANH